QVERFDYENHKAFVRRVEPDYWTEAMTFVQVSVIEESALGIASVGPRRAPWPSGWGEVAVVEKVIGYKKIKFYTHENAGYGDVRLPEMQMHTTAFWLTLPEPALAEAQAGRPAAIDGLRGIGLALETVATLALMCDPRDLGATLGDVEGTGGRPVDGDDDDDESDCSDESGPGPQRKGVPGRQRGGPRPGYSPTLFLYEHVPGGTGLAERIWEQRDVLLDRTRQMIETCPCATGCPACVGPGHPHNLEPLGRYPRRADQQVVRVPVERGLVLLEDVVPRELQRPARREQSTRERRIDERGGNRSHDHRDADHVRQLVAEGRVFFLVERDVFAKRSLRHRE